MGIPDTAAEGIEQQQPQQYPSRKARRGQGQIEAQVGGVRGAEGGGGAGSGDVFDGVQPGSWRWPMKTCSGRSWGSCRAGGFSGKADEVSVRFGFRS